MANTLIASTTGATQSDAVVLQDGQVGTIVADNFATGEYGDLQISVDGGTTWKDSHDKDGQVRLTDTLNTLRVVGPLLFRIDKDATSSATAIVMHIDNNV